MRPVEFLHKHWPCSPACKSQGWFPPTRNTQEATTPGAQPSSPHCHLNSPAARVQSCVYTASIHLDRAVQAQPAWSQSNAIKRRGACQASAWCHRLPRDFHPQWWVQAGCNYLLSQKGIVGSEKSGGFDVAPGRTAPMILGRP